MTVMSNHIDWRETVSDACGCKQNAFSAIVWWCVLCTTNVVVFTDRNRSLGLSCIDRCIELRLWWQGQARTARRYSGYQTCSCIAAFMIGWRDWSSRWRGRMASVVYHNPFVAVPVKRRVSSIRNWRWDVVGLLYTKEMRSDWAPTVVVPHMRCVTMSTSCAHNE